MRGNQISISVHTDKSLQQILARISTRRSIRGFSLLQCVCPSTALVLIVLALFLLSAYNVRGNKWFRCRDMGTDLYSFAWSCPFVGASGMPGPCFRSEKVKTTHINSGLSYLRIGVIALLGLKVNL